MRGGVSWRRGPRVLRVWGPPSIWLRGKKTPRRKDKRLRLNFEGFWDSNRKQGLEGHAHVHRAAGVGWGGVCVLLARVCSDWLIYGMDNNGIEGQVG